MSIQGTTTVDTEQVMRNALNRYLCTNVWNMPATERRRNITLRTISKGKFLVNACDLRCQMIRLPDASSANKHGYYIYAAPKCCMGGIIIDTEAPDIKQKLVADYNEGWLRLDAYLNARPFDLRIHGTHGQWLHRRSIYIKNHPYEDMFLIAIEKNMAQTVLGSDYDFLTIYMGVYYDSDNELDRLEYGSPTIRSFYPTSIQELNDIHAYWSSIDHGKSMCFINGRESIPMALTDIHTNEYVEIVYDPDIICSITLDMTDPECNHIYSSSVDATFKYIMHIPKACNPENHIITHNTCDLFIRPLNTPNETAMRLRGLFVHRVDTARMTPVYGLTDDTYFHRFKNYYTIDDGVYTKCILTEDDYNRYDGIHTFLPANTYYTVISSYLKDFAITQITHNDFGISEKILQPYMKYLGSTEYAIRLVVRRHNKSNVLKEDNNFLKILYTLTDEQILKFLDGSMNECCPFWKAENLEQSEWCKMLFAVPPSSESQSTSLYLDALGYYNALSIITPKRINVYVNNLTTRTFEVPIPISMLGSDTINLSVSLNSVWLNPAEYSYQRNLQFMRITFVNTLAIGDKIVCEFFDAAPLKAEYFTPTADNKTFTVGPYDKIDIYEVKDFTYPVKDYFSDTYCPRSSVGYKKVDYKHVIEREKYTRDGLELTGRVLTWSPVTFNKKYFLVSQDVFKRYNADVLSRTGNITLSTVEYPEGTCTDLLHSGKLTLTASGWTSDTSVTFPIINPDWNVIPFCNGRELVRDIDYSIATIKDEEDYILHQDVLFSVNGIGRVSFYNRDSYLHRDVNEFNLILTSDKQFTNTHGFTHLIGKFDGDDIVYTHSVIREIEPYTRWFANLCVGVADGRSVYHTSQDVGTLRTNDILRNGALYGIRGTIPADAKNFVDQYKTSVNDDEKLTDITRYLRSIDHDEGYEREVIEHSHHVTSILLNCIVKDVLTGKKTLVSSESPEDYIAQVQEYLSLKNYDPVFTGISNGLLIESAGSIIVNGLYRLEEPNAQGYDRVWKHLTNWIYLQYNKSKQQWQLIYIAEECRTVLYTAEDRGTGREPSELHWNCVKGVFPLPQFTSRGMDLKYIDVFPSYTSDLHPVEYNRLLQGVIDALLPKDPIKDGDTPL